MELKNGSIIDTEGDSAKEKLSAAWDIWKCKKHPRYKAIRKPSCECPDCWRIWNLKNIG